MEPILNMAKTAIRASSKEVLRLFNRLDLLKVNRKPSQDFVSEADLISEQEISKIIRRSFPEHGILTEESGFICGDKNSEWLWVIDPLDGTTNFIHGIPHFAIAIAILYQNRPYTSIIYDPIRDEMFTAVKGQGARINNKRIRVNNNSNINDALVVASLPTNRVTQDIEYWQKIMSISQKAYSMRRSGSFTLDLAYLAAGRIDAIFAHKLQIWDIASGILLIKEAGGIVTDFSGKDNALETGEIIATNNKLFRDFYHLCIN